MHTPPAPSATGRRAAWQGRKRHRCTGLGQHSLYFNTKRCAMQGWGVFFTILPHLGARGAHSQARPGRSPLCGERGRLRRPASRREAPGRAGRPLQAPGPCKTLRAPPSNSRVLLLGLRTQRARPSARPWGFAPGPRGALPLHPARGHSPLYPFVSLYPGVVVGPGLRALKNGPGKGLPGPCAVWFPLAVLQ